MAIIWCLCVSITNIHKSVSCLHVYRQSACHMAISHYRLATVLLIRNTCLWLVKVRTVYQPETPPSAYNGWSLDQNSCASIWRIGHLFQIRSASNSSVITRGYHNIVVPRLPFNCPNCLQNVTSDWLSDNPHHTFSTYDASWD